MSTLSGHREQRPFTSQIWREPPFAAQASASRGAHSSGIPAFRTASQKRSKASRGRGCMAEVREPTSTEIGQSSSIREANRETVKLLVLKGFEHRRSSAKSSHLYFPWRATSSTELILQAFFRTARTKERTLRRRTGAGSEKVF